MSASGCISIPAREEQGGKDFWDRTVVLTNKDANLPIPEHDSPRNAIEPFRAGFPPLSRSSPLYLKCASKKHGIVATAQEVDGEFTVFEGSGREPEPRGSESRTGTEDSERNWFNMGPSFLPPTVP